MKTNCFYSQLNYSLPRTAIAAKILFAARVMQVRFLGAVIKPVHPCTGLIARFAQQNALLLRTTDIRVGTEKKTPREQNSSGKKIGSESAVLHFVFFIVMVNKMQQSAKKARNKNNKSSLPEFFRLRQGLPEAEKRGLLKRGGADTRRQPKIKRRRIGYTSSIYFRRATP